MTKPTQQLHDLGQSLWIDNISRETLRDGSLARLIAEDSVTGLTSNPTIFEKAMGQGEAYDHAIAQLAREGRSTEDLFFALAVDDLQRAADLFAPAHEASGGVDGWVSLEVSPLLVNDTQGTIRAAASLHMQAGRKNLFIKIPGTPEGIPAIEQSIYQGIPINVTLLFSCEQTMAAAEAYLKGIERRLNDGKSPVVESVLSLFVSRWDAAVKDKVSAEYQNRLGIAVALRTYKAWRELLASERWKKLAAAGAHPQRLLWASTGTKDPKAPETLYVEALAAPGTIDTMPDKTLKALADHGRIGRAMPEDGGDAERTIAEIRRQGVDIDALALKLQNDGGDSFAKSWRSLIGGLEEKIAKLTATSPS
jgi:transaldolase